jgi:trehalose 6-phosphate synthase
MVETLVRPWQTQHPRRPGPDSRAFAVVANRLAVTKCTDGTWTRSPGGLVSALGPVMASREGVWVGWPGTLDGSVPPSSFEGMQLDAVHLEPEEKSRYYEGFCNGTVWPLFHDAIQPPAYNREWWRSYQAVNRRFAEATAARLEPGGTAWVHDYQLMLVPAMLRALRPDARIGFFLHIPFPPEELFARLPWRTAVTAGVLGADLIGFQDDVAVDNFLRSVERFAPRDEVVRTDHGAAVMMEGRMARVGAFPISIDSAEVARLAADPAVRRRAHQLRDRLGDPRHVLLGVDRLDYTKGIDARLRAFGELLGSGRLDPEDTVMVQVATPSREDVHGYSEVRRRVERLVGRINGDFGEVGRPPVHYLHREFPIDELVALYLAADVLVVSSYQDGMNLVAKEFVASRLDDTGRLVLSEFAGAAHELPEALLINPHDLDGTKDALAAAVRMPEEEAHRRMAAMRHQVMDHDVHRWAASFLTQLERAPLVEVAIGSP